MLFSLLKHYLDTDTALKVSQSVYCFTTYISHGVENYFPRLWGTGISDAILSFSVSRQYFENWLTDSIQIWHVVVTGIQGVSYFKVMLSLSFFTFPFHSSFACICNWP